MSSFNLPLRVGIIALSMVALAACTMTPAFNDDTAAQKIALNFDAPTNPLEQIVYQDLSTRFGQSSAPGAPEVNIAVSTASRALAQSSTTDPAASQLMTATGIIKITQNGNKILTTTRQATATYSTNSQVLADNSAATNAGDQAAHALAETLELTIISALTPAAAPASQ
ncbi:MAG: hypothetical protein ABI377_04350 [Devosia sp.]